MTCRLRPHVVGLPSRTRGRETLLGRPSGRAVGPALCVEGDLARCVMIKDPCAVASGLAGAQGLEINMIGKLVARKLGGEARGLARISKIFVCHGNTHPGVTPVDFSH